jgi:2-polyprenyl-3-methyl-5-hydroxy-6-metoxy-1,4-benzoquinol methylase
MLYHRENMMIENLPSIELNACPYCGSKSISYWGKTSGKITLHSSWWRCRDCQLIFASPLKSEQAIRDFYAQEFYREKEIDPSRTEYLQLFNWLTDLILKFQPEPKRYLEIGCGRGLFLSHFAGRTKLEKAVGIEFDKAVTDSIRPGVPFQAYNDYYEKIALSEKFDVIFAWHVIEHVLDIHSFLDKIRDDSNGIVVFGTPAFGWVNELKAFVQRRMGRTVTVGTSSDHTFFFSQKVLCKIVASHGFEIVYRKVYLDNVNEEMESSFVIRLLALAMKVLPLPLFGKQILILRKRRSEPV